MTAFVDPMDDDDHAPSGSPPLSLPSLLPTPPPRSPTPSRSGDSSGSDDGGIPTPRSPPHRSGLQPRKGCLKPPGQPPRRVTRSRSRRGVTFSTNDRCLVTGAPFTPHPRDRVDWKLARMAGESPEKRERRRQKAERRIQRRRRNEYILAGRAAAAAAAAAQGGSSGEKEGTPLEDEEDEEESEAVDTPAQEGMLGDREGEPGPVTEEEKARCLAKERARADEARRKEHSRRIRARLKEVKAKWGYVPRGKIPRYER